LKEAHIFERLDTADLRGYRPKRLAPPDDMDPPFVPDPALAGTWRVKDFVDSPAGFRLGNAGADIPGMSRLRVYPGGKATWVFQNATLAVSSAVVGLPSGGVADTVRLGQSAQALVYHLHDEDIAWTKGAFLVPAMQVAMPYRIENFDGKETLWIEWRSGEVLFGGEKPRYYVLVRE
jgi:hypothetical protein